MNRQTIEEILVERGYASAHARMVSEDLMHLEAPLESVFRQWLETGETGDYAFRGYTLRYFTVVWKMQYPAAVLTLDWILKDPERAIQELKNGIR